jgi:transglutaminase-like putative cysteine protease
VSCVLLTPWWRARVPAGDGVVEGELAPTAILDWQDPLVADLLSRTQADGHTVGVGFLRAAHRRIAVTVHPAYLLNERQPVSRTLRRRRGSCSQRLAVLEAVARAAGIPTRVRGLLVDGSFWYPRFPRARLLLPDRVVLAWPAFHLDGTWIEAGELFGDLTDLAADPGGGFTNIAGETLFDAVARTAVDWDGQTSTPGSCSSCDLSEVVLADLGQFPSRDALFDAHGQTLCWPARVLAEPLLSRQAA